MRRRQADACLNAFYKGQMLVAAAGQFYMGPDGSEVSVPNYPAAFGKRVYAVGAIQPNGWRWEDANLQQQYCATHPYDCEYSNFGPWLDCVAPGVFITTWKGSPNGYYALDGCTLDDRTTWAFGGTSASTAFVSGVAALLLKLNPNLIGEDIQELINRTAINLGQPPGTRTDELGYGYVRADVAQAKLEGREVLHYGVGDLPWALAPLVDDVAQTTDVWISFANVEQWFAPGPYACRRHRLTATFQWPLPFSGVPLVWTRSSGSKGWRRLGDTPYELFDYEKEVYEGGVVSGSVSSTGATVETYVYEVYYGGAWHWWPTDPSHARLTLTAVGAFATTDVGSAARPAVAEVLTIPNPARGGIVFDVGVPMRGLVRVVVLDAQGRQVSVVRNELMEAGRTRLMWNGRLADGHRAAPGVYFCQLRCSSGQAVRRFVLLGSAGE